jgi:hypothetical protein
MVVNLALPDGVTLAYLRNFDDGAWEAMVHRRLDREPTTIRYAVGFGVDRHNPDYAITMALDALGRDPQLVEQELIQPTCAPTISDADLANLLTSAPMTAPKPLFKLKS